MSTGERIDVQVVYALADRQHAVAVELPAGATVADALAAVAAIPPFDGLDLETVPVGIFGDRVGREQRLEPHDRVEIYRPLLLDPREARRRRAAEQNRSRS